MKSDILQKPTSDWQNWRSTNLKHLPRLCVFLKNFESILRLALVTQNH